MGSTEAALDLRDCAACDLGPGDAEALVALSADSGWNQVARDWRFMLGQGRGFGFADASGRFVASAIVWPVAARLNWISMVLTLTAFRRRGFGLHLLRLCIAQATRGGSAAGLDATELGRPLYAALGFREVYTLSRWRLDRPPPPVAPPAGVTIRPATAADLAALVDFDRRFSAMDRQPLLAHLIDRAPGAAHVALAGERIAGYALGRDGRTTAQVGPVVALDEATARALLARAAASATPCMLDVPDRHAALGAWLAAAGGTAPRRFWRMTMGEAPGLGDARGLFAIAGPELA